MWRLCPSAKELNLRISRAFWMKLIVLRYEIKDTTLLVQGLTEVPDIWKWEGLRRVSLMSNKTEKVSEIPSSHDPLTLLLQHNYLEMINNDFFQSMHSLRVLNLSWQVISSFTMLQVLKMFGCGRSSSDHEPHQKIEHLDVSTIILTSSHALKRFLSSNKLQKLKKLTLDFERAGQAWMGRFWSRSVGFESASSTSSGSVFLLLVLMLAYCCLTK
ncbi:hypothetical protein KPL70_020775 [Citrus sinensis]|nr:hypothetical protein KPL70_020775 [Citrus sinensis]